MSLRAALIGLYLIPPLSTADAGEDSQGSGAQIPLLSHGEEASALSHLPGLDPPPREAPLTGHLTGGQSGSVWEMEVEMERPQDPDAHIRGPAFDALGEAVNPAEEAEDPRRARGEGEGGGDEGGGGGETEGYECVVVTASLTDRLHKHADDSAETSEPGGDEGAGSQPDLHTATVPIMALPGHMPRQGELFHAQTLQTVVASCEIPDQQGSLEGSQVTRCTSECYST